jgi:hypothetical protein
MITEVGKDILGKYLIGTAPAYASYIAVGCGAVPKAAGSSFTTQEKNAFAAKKSLDFEMFRIPITSRGFIEEDGQTKLVFSGEVPTTNRYEITEIGIYSAASNPAAVGYDSRTIYAFTREEAWKRNEELIYTQDSPLDKGDVSNNLHADYLDKPVIQTNATNKIFSNLTRQQRSEQARYLNNMIMLSSTFSALSGTTLSGISLSGKSKISLSTGLDLSQNSPSDLLKLAVSVVDVDSDAGTAPNRVRVVAEFTTSDGHSLRFNFESSSGLFSSSRYQVLSLALSAGVASSASFSWSKVNNVNFYASAVDSSGNVLKDGSNNPTYYVSLDALRLENISSLNPLYGLTGYTVMRNSENGFARPIVKLSNTAAMIEFRLGVGVYNG